MNSLAQTGRYTNFTTLSERARLLAGLVMMFTGLYFGLFTVGIGESVGLLSVIASPFVMVSDK